MKSQIFCDDCSFRITRWLHSSVFLRYCLLGFRHARHFYSKSLPTIYLCRMEINLQGYDERRFDGPVREDLFCSICQGVLRDPRICENREHPFCLSCISQHLLNSHTCPECRENLTQQTLKDPPRFLMNTLSALKIKCNHAERGCPDYVKLEDLQTHVVQCGFTPVKCGNEECGMEVDKKDKELHERDLCQFRIAKCHDCRDIRARQNEIKASKVRFVLLCVFLNLSWKEGIDTDQPPSDLLANPVLMKSV